MLIPNNTIAVLQLQIRPGGYSDETLCLEDGWGTKAKSGTIYLRAKITVISGPQKGNFFGFPIGIYSDKNQRWQDDGRRIIREILNSSQGLSAKDNSRAAVFGRIIQNYQVLDKICFVGIVGTKKDRNGKQENTLSKILSRDDPEYQEMIETNKFAPARKTPPPSEPSSPRWLRY